MNSILMNAPFTTTAGCPAARRSGYQRLALGLGALAIAGMAATTAACGLGHGEPTHAGPSTAAFNPTTIDKALRTNVTRTPQGATPPREVVMGNPAVACGFGPHGGGLCANNG